MNEARLHARGLWKRLGHRDVLRGLDLDLRAGEIGALVGANGAGKTTLLRVLAGLSLPSGGTVEVAGWADRRGARAAVGYVGHETLLYGGLSAEENLRFTARLYGSPIEGIDELLRTYGLEAVAHHAVRSFSRGMRQRLALARAQLHRPGVLLLDEPFNALDPAGAESLVGALGAARDEGVAVCLVSHDLERSAALADRAFALRNGLCEAVSGPLSARALRAAMDTAA